MATAQETFEKVARHLFEQGVRAADGVGVEAACVYRGKNGTKCAVGCLIPDEMYSPYFEGSTVFALLHGHACQKLPEDWEYREHEDLLSSLQMVHDAAGNWESTLAMRGNLKDVGKMHGLDTAFLEGLSFKDK